MYFTWLDAEIGEVYRQESVQRAKNSMLIYAIERGSHHHSNFLRQWLSWLGEIFQSISRKLQGLPIRDGNDLSHLDTRSASYEQTR